MTERLDECLGGHIFESANVTELMDKVLKIATLIGVVMIKIHV